MEELKVLVKENKQHLALFGIITAALLVIMIGILGWKLPLISVCIIVLLEGGLAVCLQELPVWLHGLVLIAQLIVGVLFGNGIFLLICALYYVISIVVLSIWDK